MKKGNITKLALMPIAVLAGVFLISCSNDTSTLHTINGIQMPLNPGSAGKATLEGIDSDGDGIRDDVQIAIHKRYPDNKAKRDALKQNIKTLQNALIAGKTKNTKKIFEVRNESERDSACLWESMKSGKQTYQEVIFMESTLINTPERSDAYLNYNQALGGKTFDSKDFSNPCD